MSLLAQISCNAMQFREYLEAHGYDTSAMGLPGSSDTRSSIDEKDVAVTEKSVV